MDFPDILKYEKDNGISRQIQILLKNDENFILLVIEELFIRYQEFFNNGTNFTKYTKTDIFSVGWTSTNSSILLSNGRMVSVLGQPYPPEENRDILFSSAVLGYKIDNDKNDHEIREKGGYNPTVIANKDEIEFVLFYRRSDRIEGILFSPEIIDNCIAYDDTLAKCRECEAGFILRIPEGIFYSPKCTRIIQNCDTYNKYNNYNSCEVCQKGYDVSNGECKKTENNILVYVLSTIMTLSIFVVFVYISGHCYLAKKRKKLEKRQDFKILNVKLDEKTLKRKKKLFNSTIDTPFTLENNNRRFIEYIEHLKQKNEVKCYEIVQDDEFTSYSQLKKVRKLGNGGFGQVWEVTNKQEQTFALKLFINAEKFTTDQDFENFTNMTKEFQTLNVLNCPYIVYVCGIAYSFQNDRITLGIVEEYMEMDLSKFLQEKRNDLNLDEKINFAINITNCLLEIHHKNFIHHDIKLPNLLIVC